MSITISLTFRCNSRCQTCNVYQRRASELSKADKEAIQQLKTNDDGFLDFALDVLNVVKKTGRFSKAVAPLILADGPLPFGDVVFAVALGVDLGIAAYDLVVRDD